MSPCPSTVSTVNNSRLNSCSGEYGSSSASPLSNSAFIENSWDHNSLGESGHSKSHRHPRNSKVIDLTIQSAVKPVTTPSLPIEKVDDDDDGSWLPCRNDSSSSINLKGGINSSTISANLHSNNTIGAITTDNDLGNTSTSSKSTIVTSREIGKAEEVTDDPSGSFK